MNRYKNHIRLWVFLIASIMSCVAIAQDENYGIGDGFDPGNPGNPGSNGWNAATGEVIIDDFTTGNLNNSITKLIGNSGNDAVTKIVVAGVINDTDFRVGNNYAKCTSVDFSRTAGISIVPSSAYSDNTHLCSIMLPTSITDIGSNAFKGCSALTAMTCYTLTPPKVGSNALNGVADNMIVYVPSEAVDRYQEADVWKNYTILPIQETVHSLTVNMPSDIDLGSFKNMTLELVNAKSGQSYRYIITNKNSYVFNNLIENTVYKAYVKNNENNIFGETSEVSINDKDAEVTFSSLSIPQNVNLSIIAGCNDITSQATVTWTDSLGNYLSQGPSLTGYAIGKKLNYSIALPQNIVMEYALPNTTQYVVADGENNIVCTLTPVQKVVITGKILDLTTKSAISGAVVSASQTFGGKYSKTTNVKTDSKGQYSIEVFRVPTSLAIAASDYISQTVECDVVNAEGENVSVDDVLLKFISGAVISIDFTYKKCPDNTGEEGDVESYYSDYNNVDYAIFNKTQNRSIRQFHVQYPQIVLLEEVNENDILEITASSRTSAFIPVVSSAIIDSGERAYATFDIVELGKLKSSFTANTNASVVGSLYDAKGKLIKTYDYSGGTLTISNLADGDYTLITMGSSRLFNTIYDLNQLPQTGLTNGVDYVQNSVSVKSGELSVVKIDEVPTLDESKLYYTGDNTSFTVNKSSIVAGNYLTLTGHLDFKSAYSTKVSNVNLIVDLPESCSFVENSVMVGNSTSSYTINGGQITIPMARYTDRVRFCIIPTLGGEYAPSAFVQFDLKGKTVTQPIGDAYYTVQDLFISVPSTIAKSSVTISGTAIGQSAVEIYDDGMMIGNTTSMANGTWTTTCELNEPYNLSTHNIYAKVTTKIGLELISETKQVMYDVNMIVPEKVTMLYYNPEFVGQYNIVFDLINKTVSPKSYYFFPYKSWPNWHGSGTEPKDFTFIADLSNNDSTAVSGVTIRVYTDNGYWRNLEAQYNTSMNRWVAISQFVEEEAPVGVDVVLSSLREVVLDDSYLQNEYSWLNSFDNMVVEIDSIAAEKDEYEDWSDEDFLNYLHNQQDSTLEIVEYDCKGLNEYTIVAEDGRTITVKMTSCSDIEESNIANDEEYINILKSSGESLYVKRTENFADYIDFGNNVRMTLLIEGNQNMVSSGRAIDGGFISTVSGYISTFGGLINSIDDQTRFLRNALENMSIGYNMDYATAMKGYEKYENIVKALKKRYLNPINSNWANTWAVELHGAYGMKNMYYEAAQKALKSMNTIKAVLGKLSSIISFTVNAKKGYDAMVEWRGILMNLQNNECPGADALYAKAVSYTRRIFGFYYAAASADLASLISLKGKLTGVISLALFNISIHSSNWGDWMHNQWTHEIRMKTPTLKCNDKCPRCGKNPCECKDKCPRCGNKPCTCPDKCPKCGKNPCVCPPPPNTTDVQHDPSGYVYEGVASNRLQGVMASCYYKETVEDMYGDLHENVVLWDAEEYAQKNPLFTDEYGMYRWDVPKGLWQVKFEKEGYETTYSEWLPVPPPQLDINIAMKQNVQPMVKSARAYEDAVEIEFNKYMMPAYLTTDNINVSQNGKYIDGKIVLVDEEIAYNDENVKYASSVRFVPNAAFSAGKEVTLVVANRVKSYAGVQMADDFIQSFDIEKEVKSIVADSLVKVPYQGRKVVTLYVLPADAAVGKTMRAESSSDMIASLVQNDVIIDEYGMAQFEINGELPGTTGITFNIDGVKATATVIANVGDFEISLVREPKASLASGSSVYRGTTVKLSVDGKDHKIWYTTDGTCPCDENSRKLYTEPIVINSDMTLKAIAENADGDASDVATFIYSILQSKTGVALNDGWNWVSFNMKNDALSSVNTAMASGTWTSDDVIKDNKYVDMYSATQKQWIGTLSKHGSLNNTQMYKLHSSKIQTLGLTGEAAHPTETTITLGSGWNYISYLPLVNMSISDALKDYKAENGDVIKSQDEFATYSTANGWEGDLTTLTVGHGYMLKRGSNASQTSLTYPIEYSGTYVKAAEPAKSYRYAENMNIIGEVEGFSVENGDSLMAYVNGEMRGASRLERNKKVFLTVHGDEEAKMAIVLVRDGEIVATASNMIEYQSNNILGTSDSPTSIMFDTNDKSSDGCIENIKAIYNLNGVKMSTKHLNNISVGTYIIYSEKNGKTCVTKYSKR